ncbi:MAG: EamA family transporter RarD [Mesorhizobium amorphae]|nr:MAG: EamA family transporter RarD [Mesorhizobium amorphae]
MSVTPVETDTAAREDARRGFLFALSAYMLWGFLPFYLKAVAHIPVLEVLAHRILWSVPLTLALLLWLKRTDELKRALREPRTLAMAALTASIISVNWGVYVYAIVSGQALAGALGYYINPLFSIFLGAVLLGEKLTRPQWVAIALATAAVLLLGWENGGLPWISLSLAVSFGFYGFFKKTLPIEPTQGFLLEIILLTPLALALAVWIVVSGTSHFGPTGAGDVLLLMLSGLVTAVPLILYGNGAKRLRLSTLGIMQYIAPTIVFLIAVFLFREPFTPATALAFGMIWAALAIYSASLLRRKR